jgi:hypothetical protein
MSIVAGQDTFSEVAKHSQKLMVGNSTLFNEIRLNCKVKTDSKFQVHESSVCDNVSVTDAVPKDMKRKTLPVDEYGALVE